MKIIPSSTKWYQNGIGTIAFLTLCGFASVAYPQQVSVKPVADIREVMKEHARIAESNLWPGFNVKEIPVAVYDSVNTWLFFSDHPPEGFRQADNDPRVFVFDGQYPLVWGNSVARFGEVWTATSVLSNYSRRTNEKYTPKDLAGIIVHEQFHVFQRTKHPGWRQNDGALLFYPEETKEALFLSRIEKEAFKRAVLATDKKEITGWALTALDYRKERMEMVAPPFGLYENDLQRTEGLSDYIERIARGVDPLNASNMTNGIRIFEPLEIEILADRTVFHRWIFSAANQKGTMKILNHPCITYFDESYRLVKINIYGLTEAPEVITEERKLTVKYRDISLELNYSELKVEGPDFHVTI